MGINTLSLSFQGSHEHRRINCHQSGMKSCWNTRLCLFSPRIDIFKYVIYGIAAAFFVYGILLMVEGFFTTGAIKDLYGDFKITTCGRCVSAWVRCVSVFTWVSFNSTQVFVFICRELKYFFLTQSRSLPAMAIYDFKNIIFSVKIIPRENSAANSQIIGNTTSFCFRGSKTVGWFMIFFFQRALGFPYDI